jgi:phage terminase small subunit
MNARQRRFVDEYLIDLDGKHATIRAGYAPSDAKSRACRFLKTPAIVDAIAVAMAERSRRTGITPERVIEKLAQRGERRALPRAARLARQGDPRRADRGLVRAGPGASRRLFSGARGSAYEEHHIVEDGPNEGLIRADARDRGVSMLNIDPPTLPGLPQRDPG